MQLDIYQAGPPPPRITRAGLHHLARALPRHRFQSDAVYVLTVSAQGARSLAGPARVPEDTRAWHPAASMVARRLMRTASRDINVIIMIHAEDGVHCVTHVIKTDRRIEPAPNIRRAALA
jgi:hypothetical protein